MKQNGGFEMTSTMRRLGHEISKLGLRMRSKTPSNSESTDDLSCKGSREYVTETATNSMESLESITTLGSETKSLKQRRHSRNELDEDVECKERNVSIKNSHRPFLARKSRSDLAKYTPLNALPHKQDTNECNSSGNIYVKELLPRAKNGKKGKEPETALVTYRVATKNRIGDNDRKTSRSTQRPKRSKSFSGLLSWRHGSKHVHKEKSGKESCRSPECSRRYIKRSNSFSDRVELNKRDAAIGRTLCKECCTLPCYKDTNKNNISQIRKEESATLKLKENGFMCKAGLDEENPSEARLSFMAFQGVRYDEGMIETDLCSTEL